MSCKHLIQMIRPGIKHSADALEVVLAILPELSAEDLSSAGVAIGKELSAIAEASQEDDVQSASRAPFDTFGTPVTETVPEVLAGPEAIKTPGPTWKPPARK